MADPRKAPGVTWTEIHGQPELWRKLADLISARREDLDRFFAALPPRTEAIFCGAGSSAFVAESVAGLFEARSGVPARAVATTDLVTHPDLFFRRDRPLLLVSFARSGNSPESIAAFELAESRHGNAFHLVLTCNRDGALAKRARGPSSCLILLPDEANDRGLAMIGSVSGMILAALLIADRARPAGELSLLVDTLAKAGTRLLEENSALFSRIGQLPFRRLICLGSGPLLAVARESHLKVQELSDGQVMACYDSFLGFRHGPRAVVNGESFLLYLLSPDAHVSRYESDLTKSLRADLSPLSSLALSPSAPHPHADHQLLLDPAQTITDPAYLLPLYLLPAQSIAVRKSLGLGLDPDSPSARGAIHRVVQGVTIYPFPGGGG